MTADSAAATSVHPRLHSLIDSVRSDLALGVVYPCDSASLGAASELARRHLCRPLLLGPIDAMRAAADAAGIDIAGFELVDTGPAPRVAAARAAALARDGAISAMMKGSLHTDDLMSAVVSRDGGLRTSTRISHAFLFDLPRYHKLLAVTDCVVNIAPNLGAKRDILVNAIGMLHGLGIAKPKVAIVTAVETVNQAIPATLDAADLAQMSMRGELPEAIVEGPLGFDNAISAESARMKNITSVVAGDPDLILVPDLNAGNILYKSFTYVGGGECGGLVLGARIPVALTSRADSLFTRLASAALAIKVALAASST